MAGGKGKSSGGKSSGGKTSGVDGPKKQQSHSARAGLQVCQVRQTGTLHFQPRFLFIPQRRRDESMLSPPLAPLILTPQVDATGSLNNVGSKPGIHARAFPPFVRCLPC